MNDDRKKFRWLFLPLLLLSIALWAAASPRGNYKQVVLPVNAMAFDAGGQDTLLAEPAIQEGELVLTVEWPETVFAGETGEVRLFLDVGRHPASSALGVVSSFFEESDVVGEARLDLPGLDLFPRGTISEKLLPGKRTQFAWSVDAGQTGTYKGTLWLYLNVLSNPAGEIDRRTILARQVEIEAVNLGGMRAKTVRMAGIVGVLLSISLGIFSFRAEFFRPGKPQN